MRGIRTGVYGVRLAYPKTAERMVYAWSQRELGEDEQIAIKKPAVRTIIRSTSKYDSIDSGTLGHELFFFFLSPRFHT